MRTGVRRVLTLGDVFMRVRIAVAVAVAVAVVALSLAGQAAAQNEPQEPDAVLDHLRRMGQLERAGCSSDSPIDRQIDCFNLFNGCDRSTCLLKACRKTRLRSG